MGHLLKIKCEDSRVNVHILCSFKCPIYTHDGASAKFSTNPTRNGLQCSSTVSDDWLQIKRMLSPAISSSVCLYQLTEAGGFFFGGGDVVYS
jgi:hypothetical protein